MSSSMSLNSMRWKVSSTRHGFSGRVGSWSVSPCDLPGNCAVRQYARGACALEAHGSQKPDR